MILISINIRNPWSQQFKNLGSIVYESVFKHKYIEIEWYKDSSIVAVNFNWTIRQSHAGVDIELGLLGYCFHFNFYDNRHWNYSAGRYYKYDEENGQY